MLADEREAALPEFKRTRPKYYYYYKWMREQVTQHCGRLPDPVLEKAVRIDATELDMLLSYPAGIQQQVICHPSAFPSLISYHKFHAAHKSCLRAFWNEERCADLSCEQVGKLMEVYESSGQEGLGQFRLPLLSWKEAAALKAEHTRLALEAQQGEHSARQFT